MGAAQEQSGSEAAPFAQAGQLEQAQPAAGLGVPPFVQVTPVQEQVQVDVDSVPIRPHEAIDEQ